MDHEFYPDLPSKAAVLLYTLAKSQACPDGNKRVALLLVIAFLALNGASLSTSNKEAGDRILIAAESEASDRDQVLSELTEWLRHAIDPALPEEGSPWNSLG